MCGCSTSLSKSSSLHNKSGASLVSTSTPSYSNSTRAISLQLGHKCRRSWQGTHCSVIVSNDKIFCRTTFIDSIFKGLQILQFFFIKRVIFDYLVLRILSCFSDAILDCCFRDFVPRLPTLFNSHQYID